MKRCTIVIPCYNETARLDVAAFRRFVAEEDSPRFLLVNDGSTDDTLAVLQSLRDAVPERFEVYDLPRNVGKAEAVRRGILRAMESEPEFVGFWDADLATPLDAIEEFFRLLKHDPDLQMVIGARVKLLGRHVERRAVRHYLGRVFSTMASFLLGLPVYDTQCGAKLFRVNEEIRFLFEQPFRANWIFDMELLARFLRGRRNTGLPPVERAVYELPLTQWHDVAGSKVKPLDFPKALWELVKIYWTYLRPGAAAPAKTLPLPQQDTATDPSADSHRRRRAA